MSRTSNRNARAAHQWTHAAATSARGQGAGTSYYWRMAQTTTTWVEQLATTRVLGALLESVRQHWGSYDLLLHHQQGEFHHDVLVRVPDAKPTLPGEYLVISTNCNGGVKEVLCFDEPVEPSALWHSRCPENPEFAGVLPAMLASARTEHWFDPCELLAPDARSELKPEFRGRQAGGGWCKKLD